MSSEPSSYTLTVPREAVGTRLDRYLTDALEPQGLSRSRLQALIEAGEVRLEGAPARASTKLKAGQIVTVTVPPPRPTELIPEDIPIEVLYEDEWLLVINKPPDMAVHPARGSEEGTLVHALLHAVDDLSGVGGEERPGIVHRLDKDTSGVLVVAKNDAAHQGLSIQFRDHSITRQYRALVRGAPPREAGVWESHLGRNPNNRLKMMSLKQGGRRAVTNYQVLQHLPGASLIELTLHTGRTHQIRVHCAEAGCPVLGDEVYGGHWQRGLPEDPRLEAALAASGRQLLHARVLGFRHPEDGRYLELVAEPPEDFQRVLAVLLQIEAEQSGGRGSEPAGGDAAEGRGRRKSGNAGRPRGR